MGMFNLPIDSDVLNSSKLTLILFVLFTSHEVITVQFTKNSTFRNKSSLLSLFSFSKMKPLNNVAVNLRLLHLEIFVSNLVNSRDAQKCS